MLESDLSIAIFAPARRDNFKVDNIAELKEILPCVDRIPNPTNYQESSNMFETKREELLSLVKSKEYNVLMAWYGGKIKGETDLSGSSLELVRNLSDDDWKTIENSTVKVVGRSDITFLLSNLMQHGVSCYYGPNAKSLLEDKEKNEKTIEYLFRALESNEAYTIDFNDPKIACESKPWIFRGGKVEGRLIGGNLDTLAQMLKEYDKTGFSFQKGDILLIESNDPYYHVIDDINVKGSIHGYYQELKKARVFDYIGGLIIGKSNNPRAYYPEEERDLDVLDGAIEKEFLRLYIQEFGIHDIPILANVPCSHTSPMITLPLGRTIALDADNARITVYPEQYI